MLNNRIQIAQVDYRQMIFDFERIAKHTPIDPEDLWECETQPRLKWRFFVFRFMVENMNYSYHALTGSSKYNWFCEMKDRGGLMDKHYKIFENLILGRDTSLSPLEVEKRWFAVKNLQRPIIEERYQNFNQNYLFLYHE